MKSRPQGRGPGLHGTPRPTGAPSPPGQEIYSAATPGKWGEALQAEQVFLQSQSSGAALGLSAWGRGQGAGRRKRIRGTKVFLVLINCRERPYTLRTCIFTLLASHNCGPGSQGSASQTLQWSDFPGTHPARGGSSSSLARSDLGSQESKGC